MSSVIAQPDAVRASVAEVPRPAPAPTPRRRAFGAGWKAAVWFVAPALLVIGVFFVGPVLGAFALSFTDFDLYALADPSTARFVGLRNYVGLVENPLFWQALGNTCYFVFVGGPLSVAVSLGAALLVHAQAVRFKALWRTVFFAPVVTTLVAVAVVWKYLLHTQYGFLNYALGLLGIAPVDWLGDPTWAMPAIILLAVWKNFGYNMVIFLAGLGAVDPQLYDAAKIDGAGTWAQFRHVTLPQLAPTFLFVGVLTMVGYFQLFAEPYVMTQGGPVRSTVSIVYLMYEEGFIWWNMGVATAVAFALFVAMLIGTAIQFRLQREKP